MTEFKALAVNVKRLREAHGLSPAQLAKRAGMTAQSIHRLEEGAPGLRFGVQQLQRLSTVFHCPMAELFNL